MNNNNKDINKFFDNLMEPSNILFTDAVKILETTPDGITIFDTPGVVFGNGGDITFRDDISITTNGISDNSVTSLAAGGSGNLTGCVTYASIDNDLKIQLIEDVKKQVLKEITKTFQLPSHMIKGEK